MALNDPIPEHRLVAVFGLGATGRGAANLLAHFGKKVVVSDSRDAVDASGLAEGVEVRLGGLDLAGATAVVLSPSLNPEWPENLAKPEMAELYRRWADGSLLVLSEIDLAARSFSGRLLTVGGTDGKSTTAKLAAHLANAIGFETLLGGNSWTPLSAVLLDAPDTARHVVAEVSAFQLWEPHGLTPDAAILTNIQPDHLDHYAGEDDYVAAKRQVFRNMQTGVAILYGEDPRLHQWAPEIAEAGVDTWGYGLALSDTPPWRALGTSADRTEATVRIGDEEIAVPVERWALPGAHNRKNLLAAILGVTALTGQHPGDWPAEVFGTALGSFRGLPHRIELVGERGGVRFFNDSKATNVHAALAGLSAFEQPVVAIVGGVDKKLDLAPLVSLLAERARAVVVLGELRARFTAEAGDEIAVLEAADSMRDAVVSAAALAEEGDAVVLSPACSSFDMFGSFVERGRVFTEEVARLAE